MAEPLTSHLTFATIRLLRLPTSAALAAAHDTDPEAYRELAVVAVHGEDRNDIAGWGECSALNEPGYTSEWAAGAYAALTDGAPIDPTAQPMAAAAIEMALLDADLRVAGESLADRLGTAGRSASAGAVVGLDTIPEMLDQCAGLVDQGYQRIKCKIAPGRIAEPVRAIRQRFPVVELQVDANGSLAADDVVMLQALRDLGVTAIEQPFAVGDHANAARIVAESDLTVLADESARSLADVDAIARDQAATGIVIKAPCVGGLERALAMVDHAQLRGLSCSVGGMLESGLGRHVLAALAPLDPFTVTGDLSPAGRWLAVDPFDDIELIDGSIPAPSAIGIAGDPDVELLDAHTVQQTTVALPRLIS